MESRQKGHPEMTDIILAPEGDRISGVPPYGKLRNGRGGINTEFTNLFVNHLLWIFLLFTTKIYKYLESIQETRFQRVYWGIGYADSEYDIVNDE